MMTSSPKAVTFYVLKAPMQILSPQYWAQEANNKYPDPYGNWYATYDDGFML